MLAEDLIKLKNTLMLIEVRGENVKVMSNCLYFIDQMIADCQNGKYATNQEETDGTKE